MEKKKQAVSVLFWLRKGRTNESMAPLFCRVTIAGQRYEIPTNVTVRPAEWLAKAQRVISRNDNAKEANRIIECLAQDIENTLTKLKQKNYTVNIENFKLVYQAQENEYSTLTTLFRYHQITEAKNLSHSTNVQYAITLKHLLNFVRIRYHVTDYDINTIDKAFVSEFFAYLQGFKRQDKKKLCTINGALKHIQRFKRAMNIALQNEWISRNPVALLKAKKDKADKEFLNEEEIKAIQNVSLPPGLAIVRDEFMFAVYTGTAYVDIYNLTVDNLSLGIDRTPWLQYHRQKTGVRVSLPLLAPAQDILKKYHIYNAHLPGKNLFPLPTNQVTNRALKTIAQKSGVKKNITFHMARHTFATTITLMHGIPIETVSKMLGHTNLSTTQVYAKVVDTKIMEDMAALKDLYANKSELTLKNGTR